MYSSSLLVILLIGLVWYLASNKSNSIGNNKKLIPIILGITVIAVLAITVVPMIGGFGMYHGMGGYGMRCW